MVIYMERRGDPYKLQGSRIAFTNWHFIDPGSVGWYDKDNRRTVVSDILEPSSASFRGSNCPWGIKLTVKKASRSGPLFMDEMEWEKGGVTLTTVMRDGDIYKAWGNTGWGSSLPGREVPYVTYYESDDGYDWRRPDCGLIKYKGKSKNNIVTGSLFYGTVFCDPTSDAERFKMVCEESFSGGEYKQFIESCKDPCFIEPEVFFEKGINAPDTRAYGIRGAVSPDGINWGILPEPLVITVADTQVVAYRDPVLKKYVLYSRYWSAGRQADEYMKDEYSVRLLSTGRRSISRSESSDFRRFPLPEVIIEPDLRMMPNEVLYTNCRTCVPGGPDQHLMFPVVWNASGGDITHILLYTSHDGKIWNKASDSPVLETSAFGEWDGGCIFASPELLELPNGDFALPYTGWNVPHKYPRMNAKRNTGYAIWPKGRLMGLTAAERGGFATAAVVPQGGRLFINGETGHGGIITAEVCDIYGNAMPGRDFDSCIPINGDHSRKPVVWKTTDRLGIGEGEAVVLRFRLYNASIYSIEFNK